MNPVLTVLEHRAGAWNRMSWEALAAAQKLAAETGQDVEVAVCGNSPEGLLPHLRTANAARAWFVRHALLQDYTSDGFTLALEQLIQRQRPSHVVFPHTYQVRDFAPRLATRFRQALIPDVTAIQTRNGCPVYVRQLLQGKLSGDYRHSGQGPCFVSVQAGAFRADAVGNGNPAVEIFTPAISPEQIRSRPEPPFREAAQTVDLASAEVIVSVGRGIREKENLPVVEALAEALGAELAASRPICDNGWLPMQRQVGSSGQTVSPKVYVAIGISGAIQHLVGMKGAKTIVAINKDENAPIFETADYGIVGDLFEIVPALTAAVRKARAAAP